MTPTRRDAYGLFVRGAEALAKATDKGFRYDDVAGGYAIRKLGKQAAEAKQAIWDSKPGKLWRRRYGRRASLESGKQLRVMLYNELGLPVLKNTKKGGKASTDKDTLGQLDHPLCDAILGMRKLDTLKGFLDQWQRECVDGLVHPNFGLGNAISYRSSSNLPNAQNIPVRDPVQANVIRALILPRKGSQLVELDYRSLEVRVAACYHHDPVMVKYLRGHGDMHADTAMAIYLLSEKQVNKMSRYAAKGRFVFAEFYGSYWRAVAPDCWKACRELALEVDGVPMRKHLAKALRMPKTTAACRKRAATDTALSKFAEDVFEGDWEPTLDNVQYLIFAQHLRKVERHFWHVRFPVYNQWKKDWYALYQSNGYLDTLTGFRCAGHFRKNAVLNYPVQGSAFHCLLWAFTQITNELEARGMKTFLLGQIHDSIIADVAPGELEQYLTIAHRIMTVDLVKHWPWITVPMEVETEVAPVDAPWLDKKEYEFAA